MRLNAALWEYGFAGGKQLYHRITEGSGFCALLQPPERLACLKVRDLYLLPGRLSGEVKVGDQFLADW